MIASMLMTLHRCRYVNKMGFVETRFMDGFKCMTRKLNIPLCVKTPFALIHSKIFKYLEELQNYMYASMHQLKKHTSGEKSGCGKNFFKSFLTSSHSKKPRNLYDVWCTAFLFFLFFHNSISKKSKLYKVNNHQRLVKSLDLDQIKCGWSASRWRSQTRHLNTTEVSLGVSSDSV